MKHYLLTVQLAANAHLHAYVMTDDRRHAFAAGQRLVAEAEKLSNYPLLGLVLMTPLSTDAELVREIIGKRSAQAKRLLRTATDFHFSIWAMRVDDPDDAQLMALH